MAGKGRRIICSIYLLPADLVTEEDMRDLFEQLPAQMILLGDFNAQNPLWGSEKMSKEGKCCLRQIQPLVPKKKKKPTTEQTIAANRQ